MARDPWKKAQDKARRQHGLLSWRQARDCGLSRDQIRRAVKAGRLSEVRRLVFLFAGNPRSWEQTVLAAVLVSGPGACASHETAARLHGLYRAPASEAIHVTVPYNAPCPSLKGIVVHRSRCLDNIDRSHVGVVPVTSGARTLVDLTTAGLDEVTQLALIDDAVYAQVTRRATLYRTALRLNSGRRVGRIIEVTKPGAEPEFRSWLEATAARGWRERALPAPEWNIALNDRRGRIGIVDAVWRIQRLVVELDGLRFHSTPSQRARDAARDRRLVLAGWRVLRYTWHDIVTRPDEVAREIREALAA